MKFYLTVVFLFVTFITSAQFSEDFSDGDFTSSPVWMGQTANFEINSENQLHLVAPAVADTSYLAVNSTEIDNVIWDFWIKLEFNPSSGNNARVYLVSDQENLKGSLNGYFVLIGNTTDEISLYRQSGTTITEIIDGIDDAVDVGEVITRIRVTRDDAGNWELLRDTSGGTAFISEGTILDNTFTTTSYFGVFCKYTSSRSELFFFDELGTPYVDGVPPIIEDVTAISSTEVNVLFSESVDPLTAEENTNYNVDGGIGIPVSATIDMVNPALIHLSFTTMFVNGTTYELDLTGVTDIDGNIIEEPGTENFLYFVPAIAVENDLIITELIADPNPVVGLPEVEFFEIYNRSDKIIDLANWSINDNSTLAIFETYILSPEEYLVICSPGQASLFSVSNVLEVDGLPTLTNSEDDLVLKNDLGNQIDSIHYLVSWYNDSEKDDGGWTLERKNLDAPCSDASNWGASIHPSGGTPGIQNSIWTDMPDVTSPSVTSFAVNNNEEIVLSFDETLDTLFPITLSIEPAVVSLSGGYLTLTEYQVDVLSLSENITYQLTVENGRDCWGNEINELIEFGVPGTIEPEDLILNEIMFNPLTGGSDYVEIYNNSDKILDLSNLFTANWDEDENAIGNYEQVIIDQRLILPGEYVLLTEDTSDIINDFMIFDANAFLETDLPTYPNDSGTVFLTRSDSTIIDFFSYDESFHFDLLDNEDGNALERITFEGGMNNASNWHTASELTEFGTPGYENSQFISPNVVGEVSIDPQLFSPNNDGFNDVMTINFDLVENDNFVDITIHDNQGRLIRELHDNLFVGQKGILTWDGINSEGRKAPIGTYIVLVSVKNAVGDETVFKLVAVLGGQI